MKSTQLSKFRTPVIVGAIFVWHLLAFATFATFAFYTNPYSRSELRLVLESKCNLKSTTFSYLNGSLGLNLSPRSDGSPPQPVAVGLLQESLYLLWVDDRPHSAFTEEAFGCGSTGPEPPRFDAALQVAELGRVHVVSLLECARHLGHISETSC